MAGGGGVGRVLGCGVSGWIFFGSWSDDTKFVLVLTGVFVAALAGVLAGVLTEILAGVLAGVLVCFCCSSSAS